MELEYSFRDLFYLTHNSLLVESVVDVLHGFWNFSVLRIGIYTMPAAGSWIEFRIEWKGIRGYTPQAMLCLMTRVTNQLQGF